VPGYTGAIEAGTESIRAAVCERCGAAFPCGAAGGDCWCRERELPGTAAREIAAAFGDCLCPRCLGGAAEPGSR
jgi:hypothetical protein